MNSLGFFLADLFSPRRAGRAQTPGAMMGVSLRCLSNCS